MRLSGQIHVNLNGETIFRDPTFFEKLKRGLGAKVDLDTGRMRNQLEATAVVDGARRALGQLSVSNALSLVIDEHVIFQDTDGKADDLPDLVLALSEHVTLFGRGFRELRFAAEHEELGLHLIIETRAKTEHLRDEPAAVVSVGGRLSAFEPKRGETAEAYKARVEPLVRDPAPFEAARHQFESFVERLEMALARALPQAEVSVQRAEARLVKPSKGAEVEPVSPAHPAYDPYLVYYPSPLSTVADALMIASFMNMMHPPHVFVMHPSGAPVGTMDEVAANPDSVSADAPDPGLGADSDLSGGDDGLDGVGGSDFDGGDFDSGGGDFDGGGDFGGGGDD